MANDDIQGRVTDSSGSAVSGATVYLFKQNNPTEVITTTTDSNGDYIFTVHPDGNGASTEWYVTTSFESAGNQFTAEANPYVSSQIPSTIPNSVVHHWTFNEGSGTTVFDSVGSNHGTITGASFDTDAAVGSHSLAFSVDDFVDLSNIDLLGGDFALSAWVKTTETNDGAIIAENGASGGAEYRFVVGNGDLVFRSQANTFTHTASLNDGNWHHVVVTRNGSTLEFYIDNSSVFTDTYSNTTTNNQTTRMGVNGSFTGNDQLSGNLDDLMVADGGWDSAEVDVVYSRGV